MADYDDIFLHGVACCRYSTDGRILSANPAFCELTGYTETDLQALSYTQLTPAAPLSEQETGPLPAREFRHKLGHSLWLAEHRSRIPPDPGKDGVFISQFFDLSRNRLEEQRLRLAEHRFKLSQRHANYGVWDWNIQTNELYWSDQICPLLGLSGRQIEANYTDFINAIHPDDRDYVSEAVRAAVEDHAEYDIEHRVIWSDGTVRWIRETGDVIRAENDTPLNMIGVARDVTAYHNAEHALQQSTEQLKQAQAIAHVGHWSWDVASGKLYWSDEIYRIFGYQPGEFEPTYDKFLATLHPYDIDRIKQSEDKAFAEGKPHSIDHRIIRPDGSEVWVHEEAMAITNAQGEPIRLTGTVQNISERKYLEQQLADKIAQAQAANSAKSTFLSHISHELRTPLNGILGFAQIMELEELPVNVVTYVNEIKTAGWHLLDLMDDLLDLSRIESGNLELQIGPVDLNELLRECQSMVKPLLTPRKLKFIAAYEDCTHFVVADRRRLKQVIVNLLSNAIKYNRPGGEVEVYCQQTDGRLRIHVRDTGQGIAKQLLPRLFMPFDRLGKEGIEESGTGIGLVLVKRLTEKMGGEIGVISKQDEGSTFWIEFPRVAMTDSTIAEQQQEYVNEVKSVNRRTINILYVEDNPANMRLMERFIAKKEHIELLTASSVSSGLEIAREKSPDIILMDIKLPDMSGYEALARLKAMPETAGIPVIAVSAIAHEHDIAAGLNAGFVRYLTKPLNLELLEETLYYVLKEHGKLNPSLRQAG